jgi:RNA polymerase sigma-70 factor (ECF subfamily)
MPESQIINSEEQSLVALLATEDSKAFEVLYDRYATPLYRYVYNRLRIKEVSEELVQEVFTSLWTNRKKVTITSSLSSYLFGATKYRVFNYMRGQRVRRRYATDFGLYLICREDNSSEELMNVADIQAAIEGSISELPAKCQMAFRLSRMEHLPIQDIADRMQISRRTVENYISQALRHLRESRKDIFPS